QPLRRGGDPQVRRLEGELAGGVAGAPLRPVDAGRHLRSAVTGRGRLTFARPQPMLPRANGELKKMDPDKIDYPAILQDALRDVVRRVLEQVAEHGLPGEHHFYIGFRSQYPGVEVPRFLREQYPEEITIILQNQF